MRNPFKRRQPEEQRAVTSVPWVPFNVGPSKYERPSEQRALSLAPVFAAFRFLCDGVSTLPLKGYRRAGPDQREPMPSLPQLFQFLDDEGTLVDWTSQAVFSLAAHGNAIGVITSRDGFGFPTVVVWRPRSEFFVDDDSVPGRPQWYWNGRQVDRSELVHIPWMTIPGQTLGLSPIEHYALTLNVGLQSQKYGADWFAAGGHPPGKFKNAEQKVNQDEASIIKARLVSAIRSREPIVYGKDWDYDTISVSPQEAQFVETQNLSANQIAAIYGIAPEEIGGVPANSLTYDTEELRQIRRIADLRPWLVRFEAGLSALLPERQYVKFNADATVRADLKARYQAYHIALTDGWKSKDEVRATEDLEPLPNGQGQEYAPLHAAPVRPALTTGEDQDEDGQPLRIVR